MVERRKEVRVRIAVRVKVSGTDARCESFSENVLATNLSRSGALLPKLKAELRCGDLVTVEYRDKIAHFRIVWVMHCGRSEGSQVAIHKLATEECPWKELLPLEQPIER